MSMRRLGVRMSTWVLIAAVLIAIGLARGAAAETEKAAIVAAPLVATPIAPPNPVLGSDDKIHLVYGFVLMNMAPGAVAVEKIETLDAENEAVIGTLDGEALAEMFRLNGGGKGTELPGGGSGFVFMDARIAKDADRSEDLAASFYNQRGEGSGVRKQRPIATRHLRRRRSRSRS